MIHPPQLNAFLFILFNNEKKKQFTIHHPTFF